MDEIVGIMLRSRNDGGKTSQRWIEPTRHFMIGGGDLVVHASITPDRSSS